MEMKEHFIDSYRNLMLQVEWSYVSKQSIWDGDVCNEIHCCTWNS